MILIVAEKRSVAEAIARYLGGPYRASRDGGVPTYRFSYRGQEAVSIGLAGHLMDFDFTPRLNVWTWVPPEELFNARPILVLREEARRYVATLRRLSKRSDVVYLALDADSEGEAIAYEAALVVKQANPKVPMYRVRFNAVTVKDIRAAFASPRPLDLAVVEKVFTRMQLDLTLGAVFTRFLTLSSRAALGRGRFLSYGPCQTPVLGLVVSREEERKNFKPEKYYVIRALVEVEGHRLEVRGDRRYETRTDAEADAAKVRWGVVAEASYREHRVEPPEPLDTVELERRASRWLGIRAKEAMDLAEELYRRGYISYPRTETTIYPPTLNLREVLEELKRGEHGDYAGELLRRPTRPTRGDSDDKAHPPIYPTRGATRGEVLRELGSRRAWALYDLVVRHFLATLSEPAVVERQRVTVDFDGILLHAEGREVLHEGYWRIYPWERQRGEPLPRIHSGAPAAALEVEVEERETEPPPRMTESELLALMKKYGIGTDATMQDHIHINAKRGYMKMVRGYCIPTPLGEAVALSLMRHAPELVDPHRRAWMEKALSAIASRSTEPHEVLQAVKRQYAEYYARLRERRREIAGEIIKALKSALESHGGSGRG